jgi:hypothetical protein
VEFRLPEDIYSPEHIDSCLIKLGQYAGILRQKEHRQKLKLDGPGAVGEDELAGQLEKLLGASGLGLNPTSSGVDNLIEALENFRASAPVVHVTLAAMPGPGLKKQLAEWMRKNLYHNLLVSFGYNREIVGGMVVRTASHIYDFSWRAKLYEKREVIPGILRRLAEEAEQPKAEKELAHV